MIKAILFDFGGVLGSQAISFAQDERASQLTGMKTDDLVKLYYSMWNDLKVGKKDLPDFYKQIICKSPKLLSIEELRVLNYEILQINSELLSYIDELKKQGMKVVVFSNEAKEGMDEKTRKFQLESIFDNIYCSAYIGMAKPDKKLFQYVQHNLDLPPQEILVVDDWDENVEMALKLGMHAMQFISTEDCVGKLKRIIA